VPLLGTSVLGDATAIRNSPILVASLESSQAWCSHYCRRRHLHATKFAIVKMSLCMDQVLLQKSLQEQKGHYLSLLPWAI